MFGHCVYFTLRDYAPERIEELIRSCHEFLSGHEGLTFMAAGELADMHRNVNDRDFHVALHTIFRDKAAHDAYQEAARHQQFIEDNRDNWSRVRVFDSELRGA